MPKSEPFSLRLSLAFDELVTEEARRTKRSKGAVIEALAAEALKMRVFPGIAFRGSDWERRAWIVGTALDVWEVVTASRDFASTAEMVEKTDLTEAQIRLALAYREQFPEEVDDAIAQNRRSLDELRARFPTIDVASTPR